MILFPTPSMTLPQMFGAYLGMPFDPASSCSIAVATANPTYITEYSYGAFKRLWVYNHFKNGEATVYWDLQRGFADPGPYSFQLQYSHSGTPRGDDWIDSGSPTSNAFAIDTLGANKQRMFGKTATIYYRVLLTTTTCKYVSPVIWSTEYFEKHDWLIVREILRGEQLAHKLFSSEKGYLLKARRYGPPCDICKDLSVNNEFPGTIANSNCEECYGTGYISGYYPPTEYYALQQPSAAREQRDVEQRGTVKEQVTQARFLGTLQLVQGDVWVAGNSDERYYIHSVKEAAIWKGVPIVYLAELRLAPFTDVVYSIPLE